MVFFKIYADLITKYVAKGTVYIQQLYLVQVRPVVVECIQDTHESNHQQRWILRHYSRDNVTGQ